MKKTRHEHVQCCKDRAMEYVNDGDLQGGFASMCSDLDKHPETTGHCGIQLGMMMLMSGHLSTSTEMAKFIDGFN